MDTSSSAEQHYQSGLNLKTEGRFDAALTEFRRAVILDPAHMKAQLEIGALCKDKARLEPQFQRHTFEAFRKVARLDLTHQNAHDEYVLSAQKLGLLDDLRVEYDALMKKHPENALLQRCYKNIVTLSMAMIPERVNVASSGTSSGVRKLVLYGSVFLMLVGVVVILWPVIFKGKNYEKEQIRVFFKMGLLLSGAGLGGVLISTQIK